MGNRPIDGLKRRFAAVATDLASGEPIVFQRGNTGTAVRASSSIPGVSAGRHRRARIRGRRLVAPIPAREARAWAPTS